jgi:hypothetical protein
LTASDRFFESIRGAIAHRGSAGPAAGNESPGGHERVAHDALGEREMTIMADTTNTQTPGTDPTVPITPDEAVQILRALRARLEPPDDSRVAHVKSFVLAGVDPHFITASINAIGAVDAVQSAVGRSSEDVRQEAETAARWTAFTDELRTLLSASTVADRVRRLNLGLTALETYNICKQLNRDKTRSPQVSAHLQEMKRLNKLGVKSGKSSSSTPQNPGPVAATPPHGN